jgi:hypothetical protein
MAYTTIDDPSAYFQTKIFTGDGNDNRAITNDGNSDLQPDWIWFKNRNTTNSHNVLDSTRGVGKTLEGTNNTNAEGDTSTRLTSFDSDGFTVRTDPSVNGNGNGIVAWQWKANGGTTSSNSSGSITSTVQANTTAGFSIATWTGNGTGGATIGHGLGSVPNWYIVKKRSGTDSWAIYHHKNTSAPETDYLHLDETIATVDSVDRWNDTAPTSTVVSLGDAGAVNGSGATYVGYFFCEKKGYSKFGSYTGNGNTDGAFVYLGFKPAWIMVKATDVDEWRIYDHKRANAFNVINVRLKAHTNAAESQDDNECDFLSNGVKFRSNSGGVNSSGQAYIYMAFAEHPFVSSEGVPTTAR